MDLTDPKKYPVGTRGRREQDDYKANYDTAKQTEAINANTDELEGLTRATNTKLDTANSHLATIKDNLATVMNNTNDVEQLLTTLNTSNTGIGNTLATIKTNTDEVETKLNTLITATSTLAASLETIIATLGTIADNTSKE